MSVVRNNPNYHRYIRNIGYYWALSDYVDFATWLDWRSGTGAAADSLDRGWTDYNAQWQYNWLSRQLRGSLAGKYQKEGSGNSMYSVFWKHDQEFGANRHFNMNVNYTSNTTLQRRNTFNPYAAIATIGSTLNYSDKIGPMSLQVGGTRTQYPGRDQVQQTLPTLSLTSPTINIAPWLAWTPSFKFVEQATLHSDAPPIPRLFKVTPTGALDSVKVDKSAY